MRNSIRIVIVLVALVALAGCGSSGPGADPTDTEEVTATSPTSTDEMTEASLTPESDPTPTETVEPAEITNTTDTADEASPTTTPASWEFFQFDGPVRYEYELRPTDGETATIVLDVTDVSEDEVTAETTYRTGNQTFSQNVSGTPEQVRSQLMQSPAGAVLISGMFNPALTGIEDNGELRVGASWEYTAEGQTLRYEVTGEDSYAGVDCYTTEASVNGTQQAEFCVSPDLGLAPYIATYDDGSIEVEMELVDYKSG